MATNEAAAAETSRDTAEGDAFLVEWDGEQMYALAFVKRGRVHFRTAQSHVLPADTTVISRLAPALDSTETRSDAAVIEWKGARYHALAFIKHGKRFYRLADGRSLGRATFVSGLADPDNAAQLSDTAGETGDWTESATDHSVRELPLPGNPEVRETAELGSVVGHYDIEPGSPLAQERPTASSGQEEQNSGHAPARRPASTGHWSDAIVDEPSPTAAAPKTVPAATARPSEPALPPTASQQPPPPTEQSPQVRFDGQRWQGVAVDGSTVTVWEGQARLAEVDTELAAAEQRVRHLTELRRMIDGDREAAIAEHIARFAEIDGIHDLADATDTQRATWRRYAEGIVGD
ncbi:hypothetical protein [Gordonia aichiensis]|uniref:hypothetical protein n=1 Tax=Gordonia aichiensis TaxID=36820 RepID=UPI003267CF29